MCLIVDVNVGPNVFLVEDDPAFGEVHRQLFTSRGSRVRIVYGGKLREEYSANAKIRRILVALDQAGRAQGIDDQLVASEMERVIQSKLCQSNDEHIIALARVTGVRLLCSHDRDLHADFTSKALLDTPRGKVYQNPSHRRLLRQFCK